MEMDAGKCKFLPITIFGRQGLFYGGRLERASVPKGWHMYEVSHQAKNPKRPVQIGKMAISDFYGTVVTPKAIKLPEGEWDYRSIRGNRDFCFLNEPPVTLKTFGRQRQRKKHKR